MDGINVMKELYKYFGKKKEDNQDLDSIANIFYEIGNGEDNHECKNQQYGRFTK